MWALTKLFRLDKPTGVLLLFFPCGFATAIFSQNYHDLLYYLTIFLLGSIIMRSAGCIINDLLDRKLDAKVTRTRSRPLASKEISIVTAIVILGLLLLTGLWILLQLPPLAIQIGLLSSILIVFYPLIKRFSNLPQVFLGLTFSIGALIATATIKNSITLESMILYIGCAFWTIGYDSVYGFMDIEDDKKIGIKSLSRLLEKANFKMWLSSFYTIFILCLLTSCFMATHCYLSYLLLAILPILLQNVKTLDLTSPASCMKHFNSSVFIGSGILVILMIINFYLRIVD